MGWLVALIVLALAVFFRGFRIFLVGVIGLAVIAGGIWYLVDQQRTAAARRQIAASEVVLEDARLGRETYSASSYKLTARVRNRNTTHAVRMIELSVVLRDCQTPGGCDVVGQENDSIYVEVPPGQVRDVDTSIYFSPGPVFRGEMSWSYQLTGIVAAD